MSTSGTPQSAMLNVEPVTAQTPAVSAAGLIDIDLGASK